MNIKYTVYWEIIKVGLYSVFIFLAIGLGLSIPLCLLWNWLMPHIFGLPTINILEAFGLSALITFLNPTAPQGNPNIYKFSEHKIVIQGNKRRECNACRLHMFP